MSFQSINYRIDASDRIVFTDAAWFEFARINGFANPDVLGTSLGSHITDRTTAHLYQAVVQKVRSVRKPAQVSFRCDAPTERRFMVLEVTPEEGGALLFCSITREMQFRPPVLLIDEALPRSGRFLTMCSWCKRVFLADQWIEAEAAIDRLCLFASERLPQITHTICPVCAGQFELKA